MFSPQSGKELRRAVRACMLPGREYYKHSHRAVGKCGVSKVTNMYTALGMSTVGVSTGLGAANCEDDTKIKKEEFRDSYVCM